MNAVFYLPMMKPVVSVSVRQFVEFLLRSGDLSGGFRASASAADGIRVHQKLQKQAMLACGGEAEYLPEVPVTWRTELDSMVLELGGRIDGLLLYGGEAVIEEIKTTARDPSEISGDDDPVFWGQAQCYAAMYCAERGCAHVTVRLIYCRAGSGETRAFERTLTRAQLEGFLRDLVERYRGWAELQREWALRRDRSIEGLRFPYDRFRIGQREMSVTVYRAIRDGTPAFIQAPTGTGKTIAAIFPAVRSIGDGTVSRLFYLTAKTIAREVAEKAIGVLREKGLHFRAVTLTAKEKICFTGEAVCDPDECPYAKGYYDRINAAIRDIFPVESVRRPDIEAYARKHSVCPFEFSLDLSLWADGIICDYNYLFDPRVYLRRFFSEGAGRDSGHVFLVDEAHNLVERAREMYSASLSLESFRSLRASMKEKRVKLPRQYGPLHKSIGKVMEYLGDKGGLIDGPEAEGTRPERCERELPSDLLPLLRNFLAAAERLLVKEGRFPFRETLVQGFFDACHFLHMADNYGDSYVTTVTLDGKDVRIKLFCVDPAPFLRSTVTRGRTGVFFSATLTPPEYFAEVLGGAGDAAVMRLSSPFPRENLCVMLDDRTPTRLRRRDESYDRIAEETAALAGSRVGNYMVYFPSYRYLKEVRGRFEALAPGTAVITQSANMSEREREQFLGEFSVYGERTLVGFAVMGGVFGEGIDLAGERLSGVVIVGVGLPQIGFERDIVRDHFQAAKEKGFAFAYQYPGMNKVLQAAGRLIRTETDRGVILLIDERFACRDYRTLLPPEWDPIIRTGARPDVIRSVAERFWDGR